MAMRLHTADTAHRLVHAPTHPDGALAAMKGSFQVGAVLYDPSIERGVIDLHAALQHEFFAMARAQGIRHVPADAHKTNVLRKMGPFEADRHPSSPPAYRSGAWKESIPQMASHENCDR